MEVALWLKSGDSARLSTTCGMWNTSGEWSSSMSSVSSSDDNSVASSTRRVLASGLRLLKLPEADLAVSHHLFGRLVNPVLLHDIQVDLVDGIFTIGAVLLCQCRYPSSELINCFPCVGEVCARAVYTNKWQSETAGE